MAWQDTIREIRRLKIELASIDPGTGPSVAPHDGAPMRTISIAERRMRRRLPPSYRAFLHQHDGWPLFFQGASLLGTRELVQSRYADLTRAVFESYETPIPELGPPARPEGRAEAMIPFGIDPRATTLFAFNPAVVRPDGEMEVIAWVNGLGERYASFDDLLAVVRDMLQADVLEQEVGLQKSA
jgi:hypothetical protein